MLRAAILTTVMIAGLSIAHAEEGAKSEPAEVMIPPPHSAPAKVYSGSVPVDLSRGVRFTNGTYGTTNSEYEAFSKGTPEAPGLTEANYMYAQKDHFVEIVDSLMDIYREGLQNLKDSKDNRPELVQYRTTMEASLADKLDAANKALSATKSASQSNWEDAQKNMRVSFNELQALFVRKP